MKFDSNVGIVAEDDLVLDADGADIILKDGGTEFGRFKQDQGNLVIKSAESDKDIVFRGNDGDGGGTITALTLDMSAAGAATFNSTINNHGFKESSTLTTDSDPESQVKEVTNVFSLPPNSVIVEVIVILTSGWSFDGPTSGYINIQIKKDNADNLFNSDKYLNNMSASSVDEGTTNIFAYNDFTAARAINSGLTSVNYSLRVQGSSDNMSLASDRTINGGCTLKAFFKYITYS